MVPPDGYLLRLDVLANEKLRHALLHLLYPLGNLDRMDLVLRGDLVNGLDALKSFERDARLELGVVGSTFSTHRGYGASTDGAWST